MVRHGVYVTELKKHELTKGGRRAPSLSDWLRSTNGAWVFEVAIPESDRDVLARLGHHQINTTADLSKFKNRNPDETFVVVGYEIELDEAEIKALDRTNKDFERKRKPSE